MSLYRKHLFITFLIALALTLTAPILFPSFHLFYFAPFLVITIYKKPLLTSLWIALACGLIVDLLSPLPKLGIHAFNYTLVTFGLYRLKKNFFADVITTLPLMTYFFSFLSTALHSYLMLILGKGLLFSWWWLSYDLVIYPLFDATYAFLIFLLPNIIIGQREMKGEEYFMEES